MITCGPLHPEHRKKMRYLTLFLRLSLAASFLSSLTSRTGIWGPDVGWGNYAAFLDYTARINPWLPPSMVPAAGWFVNVAEFVLPVLLITGIRLRETAIASGILLTIFALSMCIGKDVGVISMLDHSVLTAAAAAFLLAHLTDRECQIDQIR